MARSFRVLLWALHLSFSPSFLFFLLELHGGAPGTINYPFIQQALVRAISNPRMIFTARLS